MKNYIYLIMAFFSVHFINADIMIERTFEATKGDNWTFELKNKSKAPLYFKIGVLNPKSEANISYNSVITLPKTFNTVGDYIYPGFMIKASQGASESQNGYYRISGIDPTQEYTIFIWNDENAVKSLPFVYNSNNISTFEANAANTIAVIQKNPKRKSILLKWENNKLSPQTGIIKGLKRVTQSNIPTSNNVGSKDIIIKNKTVK